MTPQRNLEVWPTDPWVAAREEYLDEIHAILTAVLAEVSPTATIVTSADPCTTDPATGDPEVQS